MMKKTTSLKVIGRNIDLYGKTTFSWLKCIDRMSFCVLCNKALANNINHLKRHESSSLHVNKVKTQNELMPIKCMFAKKTDDNSYKTKDEIKCVMYCIQQNLLLSFMDSLPELIKSVCSDSTRAKAIKCGRTKTTSLIKTIIGPFSKIKIIMDFAILIFRSIIFSSVWMCSGARLLDFKFYWNIPSFMCKKFQIEFETLQAEYGIIQNQHDTFRGDQISILYDPGNFPAILQNTSSNELFYRNHGVPQKGNLSAHLELFEMQLAELIPDSNFSGIAVIDFESWRPVYRQNFGTLKPYKTLSMEIEQQNHPSWPKKEIEKEAELNFEINAKAFILETLLTAKKIRPHAKWGYYAFPYCFNNGKGNRADKCAKAVHNQNNMIQWMFQSSDAIYPSVYLQEQIPALHRIPFIRGRVTEALRIAKIASKGNQKPQVLVYHRYMFTDTLKYIDTVNTLDMFKEVKHKGADGIILWGSSYDLNSLAKCKQFQIYLKEKLGPAVRLASHLDI